MAEDRINITSSDEDVTYNYEPENRVHDDDAEHTEVGTDTRNDGLQNKPDEESFSSKDFRTVDEIMDIIDEKKADSPDKGNEDAKNNEKEQTKESSRKNSEPEQSASSEDSTEEKQPADGEEETQESKSESDKEVEFTDIELDDEQDIAVEIDGEQYSVSDIIDEWTNNRNWQKANTEKAQEIAEERKVLDAFNNEDVMTLLKDKDFLDAVDDWNDGKSNPLRSVVENLDKMGTSIEQESQSAELTPEEETLARERTALEVDREILELQSIDESLKDETNMEQLLQFAVDNQMTLEQAHKYKVSEDLENELDQVRTELKERNKELSELKKSSGKPIPTAPVKGSGSKGESLPPNTDGWRGAEDRVLAKLGL